MKKIKINWESIGIWMYLISFWSVVIVLAGLVLTGCTTPKIVERHHHHYEQADTLAVQAMVDKQLTSWHAQMDSSWRQSWQEYSASWFSHDDQKEHITETVTTFVDSLGREVRQEQRTTERSLSRMQQQTEQRLSREFEQRMSVVVDSLNDIWQQRFNAMQAHLEQTDSSSVQRGFPASESIPWYKRWWRSLKDHLLIAAVLFILISTTRFWLPLCINLFRRIWKTFKA